MTKKLPVSNTIKNKIKKGVESGLNSTQIFQSIQNLQNAPRSTKTFYLHYGQYLEEERANIIGKVGAKVIHQALNGDPDQAITWNSQKFFLQARGGWIDNKSIVQVTDENLDEDISAVETLMVLLGKKEVNPNDEPEDGTTQSENNC